MPLESSVTGVNPNQYGSRKESGIDTIPVGSQGAAGSPPAAPGPAASQQGPVDVIEPGATPVGDVGQTVLDPEDHDMFSMLVYWGDMAQYDDEFREIAEELNEQIGQSNGQQLQPVGLDNAIQPSAQPIPQAEAAPQNRVSGQDYQEPDQAALDDTL